MLRFRIYFPVVLLAISCGPQTPNQKALPETVTLTRTELLDKIKGGWAGQTIGCTYGGPTEFKFRGTMIQDYTPIVWPDGYIKRFFDTQSGLYDDIYMDLTFMSVFERLGLDAPADSIAMAFATAGYSLWHANQAARYNILNGIMPPASGHWLNNPHADDIDFQIEADFAGLMSPGMPVAASEFADRVGHIMNYGDGWYGGVYVAAMYSLAFVSDDIEFVVNEALKIIPQQSNYHQCMSDVIRWYREFPDDWKRTWFECQKKWSSEIGCPDGVFVPLNIDVAINSAYVLIGLLYGEKDFFKTMDIATRCGQDSDCNPATACGILGTMLGYNQIPEYWLKNLREVEERPFAHTDISLNRAYTMGMDLAMQVIERNGGTVDGNQLTIRCQEPLAVRYEKSFEGIYPVELRSLKNRTVEDIGEFRFDGTGVVFMGDVRSSDPAYVARVEVILDGKQAETVSLPAAFRTRRHDIFWQYLLPKGEHTVTFRWLNRSPGATVLFREAVVYSDAPLIQTHQPD